MRSIAGTSVCDEPSVSIFQLQILKSTYSDDWGRAVERMAVAVLNTSIGLEVWLNQNLSDLCSASVLQSPKDKIVLSDLS